MIAVVCPGQGSQTPGFMLPWLELDSFSKSIDEMASASVLDLRGCGTVSDADTIRDTAVAQPLIVAAGVASLAALLNEGHLFDSGITGVAGHSVGEVTAAIASGIITAAAGINLVKERGNAMALAASLETTSMAAILGGDQQVIEARLAELGLEPANYNGGGQIVAAGSASAIAELQAEPPTGTRVIPLQVAGAFHTRYMEPAVATLAAYTQGLELADPKVQIWSNNGGREVTSGAEYISLLVSQIKSPVRWDLTMAAMATAGVTGIIEVSPGGTLVGLAKRSMPGVELVALKTPDNLEAAQALIRNHSN
jgi:[acyl-carrier-protein] S-malonyltransferase